ncbi:MAG: hypothetical protein IJP75_08535 [Bacteroidaceae bacterium]|nr:hypothetical protein [Bacteroidaceae bacterium]
MAKIQLFPLSSHSCDLLLTIFTAYALFTFQLIAHQVIFNVVATQTKPPPPPNPPLHYLKIGVTHTATPGLTHTDPLGLSHTVFEVVEAPSQTHWKERSSGNG